MAYFIDLFSPETHQAFASSDRSISGFRPRHRNMASRVKPGDRFVCYLTRVSRWCGVLEVLDGPFEDERPIFVPTNDPFTVRFHVKPLVWLDVDKAIPMHDDQIWEGLSFTKHLDKKSITWTGKVRGSLVRLEENDGVYLKKCLEEQTAELKPYPLDEQDRRNLASHSVNRPDKVISVQVPESEEDEPLAAAISPAEPEESRESIKIQALLAQVGAQMNLSIWLPRADRGRVLKEWENSGQALLERLPLNYDDATLRTIEQIDVLWLRRRSIVRAFEVEHTTSVYSGILRMADLLSLQPNMDIKLHIVAPTMKREKVFQEIRRPVFSLLERGPLAESCTFLSYDSLRELAAQRHIAHLSDSVLDEYVEEVE